MTWSIKSLLARIVNRNSSQEEQDVGPQDDTPPVNYDENGVIINRTLARLNDSSYYQSIHSTASTFMSVTERMVPMSEIFLSDDEEDEDRECDGNTSMDIVVQVAHDGPRLRFSLDLNQNFLEDQSEVLQELMMMLPFEKQISIKSILKSPTKGKKDTAKRKGSATEFNRKAWQEAGYLWKEKPTLREEEFMRYMWEMITDQGNDGMNLNPPESSVPIYDLDSYEIVQSPPSVLDLTVYDDDVDEFGVFFNQRFIVTNYLMEGSPCGLCQPAINTGLRMIRKPVMKNVRTATIVDSYELAPVYWKSPEEFTGEYLEDEQEEAQYKALQKEMVDRCNKRDYKTNPRLEEFKNGTWRLTIFEESEEALSVEARKAMTSGEIQKMFGLSEAGSIILNVDHIDVVQGKCGFNRGKATRRFLVPLGQEAAKRDRMRDIRRKWSGLFSSYSFAIGNLFGESWLVIPQFIIEDL